MFVEGIKMKPIESSAPTAVGRVESVASRQRKGETGVLQCLISSASLARRNVLSQAATEAGWHAILCATPDKALGAFQRNMFHFAMIDLDDRGETPSGVRKLVQTLAQDSSRLLVGVCGHEADPEEEIWVRQLGIWLYLPGATTVSEISMLCEHALQIVSKQQFDQKKVTAS
jgi:hypothetical protein